MVKAYKLKELLGFHKAEEKAKKSEQDAKAKRDVEIEESEKAPVVVTKDDLEEAERLNEELSKDTAVTAAAEQKNEVYKSQTLSRKEKRKMKKLQKQQVQQEEEVEPATEQQEKLDLDKLDRSESESEGEEDEEEPNREQEVDDEDEDDEDEDDEDEDEDEDVPLSDVEFDSDADIVPHHKLSINNTRAINDALTRIQLPWKKLNFQEHQTLVSESKTDESIKDIYDDTERELAFYKQSLTATLQARDLFRKLKIPFKRPLDYFAEMVKTDEHMDKLKSKLVKEASEKRAREEARKQRHLKKFGKQVQVATLQKRQKEKRETLEKIKSLKNKRKHNQISENDFDVGVEDAATEKPSFGHNKRQKVNPKRAAKDSKYGFGGMKRFNRKNDAQSSASMEGFSQRKMKNKRVGKSKRSSGRR